MNKELKKYLKYTTEQLLQDKFFRESILHPTIESQCFWKHLQSENPALIQEITTAAALLQAVNLRRPSLSTQRKEELWKKIAVSKQKKNTSRIWYSSVAAIAVIALILGGIGIFNHFDNHNQIDSIIAFSENNDPENKTGNIQLILAEKEKMDVDENARVQYSKNGEVHINTRKVAKQSYANSAKESIKSTPVYNQLIVPAAKRSYLELADGSKIWINANTRVIYPVTFSEKDRKIYVDGEIYIEVAPDKELPFIVYSHQIDVKVLGTKFNFSSNKSKKESSIVLVEGSVSIKNDQKKEVIIYPSQRFITRNGKEQIDLVDVQKYIAWKDGKLKFYKEPFAQVLDKLASYYDREIIYTPEVGALLCSGTLRIDNNLEKVLTDIQNTMPVNFTKQGESINVIINP